MYEEILQLHESRGLKKKRASTVAVLVSTGRAERDRLDRDAKKTEDVLLFIRVFLLFTLGC